MKHKITEKEIIICVIIVAIFFVIAMNSNTIEKKACDKAMKLAYTQHFAINTVDFFINEIRDMHCITYRDKENKNMTTFITLTFKDYSTELYDYDFNESEL